jgi:tape measure domain-containing protein
MDFGELRVTYVGDPRPATRAATEVDRINRQTARNAEANDRLLGRSKKTLADVQTREAKRGADAFIRELERTRRAERASGGGGGGLGAGAQFSTLAGGRLAFAGGGAVGGVGALAAGFIAAAKAGVEYKGTLDKLSRSFETLLGSQEAATRHLKELQDFANRTPFEFEDVARASQRFQAMGIEAGKVVPLLQDMGNAVAAVGGGKDELDRVALAIAQINAKGRVMSQEMNQLSEVGISGWKALQVETGKTREELMKMVEAGDVSAETFNKAFHRMYGDSTAMSKQMGTLAGATSTLKDATKLLLSDAFTPLHNILRDTAVELARISIEGFNAQKGLTAAASVFRSGFNMANLGGGDSLLIGLALQQGGPQAAAAMAAILRGAQPKGKAEWGQGQSWFDTPVKVPEQFQHKQKISDAEIFGAQQARAQKEAEEATRKANAEMRRQSDVLGRIALDFGEASTRVSGFSGDALQLEAALYKLSIGFHELSDANKQLAQAEINRLFSAKRAEQHLKAADDLQKTLNSFVDAAQEEFRGGKTNVDIVTEALAAFVDTGAKADDTMRKLAAGAMQLAASMDYGDQLMGFVENMKALSATIRDIPLEPGKAVSQLQGAQFSPLDLSNVKVDDWRQVAEDLSDIFSNVFEGIEDGWRGMWSEMLNTARTTLLAISRDLMKMALTGEKSGAGGIIGMAANWLGSALFGGLLGGANLPMAGASKMGGSYLQPSFAGGFADGGFIPPGKWGMTGERGPEPVFGGRTGVTVTPASKTIINKTTIINYQPRNVPNSVSSRRSTRETFEALLSFAR